MPPLLKAEAAQFCLPQGHFHSPQRKRARSQPSRPLQAQGRHGPTSVFRPSKAASGVADPGAEKAGRWQHEERLEMCGTRENQVCPTGWLLLSSSQVWPWINQIRRSGHLTLKRIQKPGLSCELPHSVKHDAGWTELGHPIHHLGRGVFLPGGIQAL